MFNRWAIQNKVIVVSWRSVATHANLRPRRRIVNELCPYAGPTIRLPPHFWWRCRFNQVLRHF
jgi:hypothetical protein